jgi:hypothetical protein
VLCSPQPSQCSTPGRKTWACCWKETDSGPHHMVVGRCSTPFHSSDNVALNNGLFYQCKCQMFNHRYYSTPVDMK